MKKFLPILLTAIIVGAAAFYGGIQYGNDVQANALQAGGTQRSQQGGGGGRRAGGFGGGAQAGNFTNGQIISKDDKSITVKSTNGSKIIFFSGSTHLMKSTDASASDLVTGKNVMVNGTANADGSINAQTIQIRSPMAANQAQK